ncbi:hypothetical protein MCEMSEM22_00370 [Comamonadaceae bacterium]
MKYRALIATATFLLAGASFAQNAPAPKDPLATPGIDKREANQDKRIAEGTTSGALTAREARRLNRGEARIDKAQDHAEADGKVTRHERKQISNMQRAESKAIHLQKHDRQVDMNHDGKRDRKG